MAQLRTFKLRQAEHRPNNYIGALPDIDKKRATAVLVRQSNSGADTTYAESRETQLGLQDYSRLLYGDDEPDVRLYDEGAGVSGQKRIDQREKLDHLYQDMHKGIIGTVVLSREDRLFRNKHMDQVGVFTRLAEEKRIKVIVPPISSASTEEKTRVYDFTTYHDLCAFQDKMREAYGYIEGHVKYMHQCQQSKADKGGWDGRGLPPGFAVKGKKQDQVIVIYEPWAKELRKLVLRAQALDWDMGKLGQEVAKKAFLFPEIPAEDRERYIFKPGMDHIPGVGYKPRKIKTIRDWLTNEMYIGWWQPDEDQPDVIIDHHNAILDYALFAEGYARLKDLEHKKDKLGIIDSPEEIERLHLLLGNFDAVWPTFGLAQRQRAFSLLINRIEVEAVSPHWIRLSVDWLDAVCPRIDVAFVWKKTPSRGKKFSGLENAIIRQHYPTSSRLEIMTLLPERTWDAIQTQAALAHIHRAVPKAHDVPYNACYRDLVPKLDGDYLFGDYQTTVDCIARADSNTTRKGSPLYPKWILPANVTTMVPLSQWDLMLTG